LIDLRISWAFGVPPGFRSEAGVDSFEVFSWLFGCVSSVLDDLSASALLDLLKVTALVKK